MRNNPLRQVRTLQRKKRLFGSLLTLGNQATNKSRSTGHVGTSHSDHGALGATSADDAANHTGHDPSRPSP